MTFTIDQTSDLCNVFIRRDEDNRTVVKLPHYNGIEREEALKQAQIIATALNNQPKPKHRPDVKVLRTVEDGFDLKVYEDGAVIHKAVSVGVLRRHGWKVQASYKRDKEFDTDSFSWKTKPGGTTTVKLLTPEGIVGEGKAVCNPDEQFVRLYGYAVAWERAFAQVQERRTAIIRQVKPHVEKSTIDRMVDYFIDPAHFDDLQELNAQAAKRRSIPSFFRRILGV